MVRRAPHPRRRPTAAVALAAAVAAPACRFAESAGDGIDPEIPAVPACDPVRTWDPAAEAFEDGVREAVADFRARRPVCPGSGTSGRLAPLSEDGALACAARLHALDMATEDFVGHEGSDGSSPDERVARTGLEPTVLHEAILAGPPSPRAAVDLLAADPAQCTALADPRFDRIGAGYTADPDGTYAGYLVVLLATTDPDAGGTASGTGGSGSGAP